MPNTRCQPLDLLHILAFAVCAALLLAFGWLESADCGGEPVQAEAVPSGPAAGVAPRAAPSLPADSSMDRPRPRAVMA